MTTDLFAFGGSAPVPPCCRRAPAPLPAWRPVEAAAAILELPALVPRAPATRVLPSLSILCDREYSFRFEARPHPGQAWTSLSPVGPHAVGDGASLGPRSGAPTDAEPTPASAGTVLTPEIDQYRAAPATPRIELRVRVHCDDLDALLRAPALLTVSTTSDAPPAHGGDAMTALAPDRPRGPARETPPHAPDGAPCALAVPALSQMDAPVDLRMRICSPTSVAMALGYWKRPAMPLEVARDTWDPRHDLYGVWPAAIRAAARRGVRGYLLRFPSWEAAAWCLDHGLPVIASVRYAAGELRGAAVESTGGHLLVLTGHDGDWALANDPAAPTAREVPRRYALADIRRVWLERTGVGYVLFDPAP